MEYSCDVNVTVLSARARKNVCYNPLLEIYMDEMIPNQRLHQFEYLTAHYTMYILFGLFVQWSAQPLMCYTVNFW